MLSRIILRIRDRELGCLRCRLSRPRFASGSRRAVGGIRRLLHISQASLQPVDFSPEILNDVCLVDLEAVLVVGGILALVLQASAAAGPARLRLVTLRRPGQPLSTVGQWRATAGLL